MSGADSQPAAANLDSLPLPPVPVLAPLTAGSSLDPSPPIATGTRPNRRRPRSSRVSRKRPGFRQMREDDSDDDDDEEQAARADAQQDVHESRDPFGDSVYQTFQRSFNLGGLPSTSSSSSSSAWATVQAVSEPAVSKPVSGQGGKEQKETNACIHHYQEGRMVLFCTSCGHVAKEFAPAPLPPPPATQQAMPLVLVTMPTMCYIPSWSPTYLGPNEQWSQWSQWPQWSPPASGGMPFHVVAPHGAHDPNSAAPSPQPPPQQQPHHLWAPTLQAAPPAPSADNPSGHGGWGGNLGPVFGFGSGSIFNTGTSTSSSSTSAPHTGTGGTGSALGGGFGLGSGLGFNWSGHASQTSGVHTSSWAPSNPSAPSRSLVASSALSRPTFGIH